MASGLAVSPSIGDLCATDPDIVVLAVPLRAMHLVAAEVAAHLPAGSRATVTDVGSVKGAVREAVCRAGLGQRYIGGHPMGGTEYAGFGAASAAVLRGVPWAVTVDADSDSARLRSVLELVTGPLASSAYVLEDEAHDESAALVSHVPHVLATQLLNLVAGAPVREVALRLAAGSFRDGTRVARTDPRRTEAMVVENAAWVAPALRVVLRDLERLADQLESNAPVAEFFDRAEGLRQPLSLTGSERVPLAEGWPAMLSAAGRAGRAVVRMEADAVILA